MRGEDYEPDDDYDLKVARGIMVALAIVALLVALLVVIYAVA